MIIVFNKNLKSQLIQPVLPFANYQKLNLEGIYFIILFKINSKVW